MVTYDRFGEPLKRGDVVAYADLTEDESTAVMDVYVVTELIDTNTCAGRVVSGEAVGNEFYLTETTKRCAFMYPDPEDEEDEEESDDGLPPTFN